MLAAATVRQHTDRAEGDTVPTHLTGDTRAVVAAGFDPADPEAEIGATAE